jgi:DNA repair protein RadC
MKKIKDLPQQERPREKMLKSGSKALSDNELLAIVIGKGTKNNDVLSLSRKIVKKIDETGIEIEAKDILEIDGIGEAKATAIAASLEFARRRIKPEGLRIKFPADILPLIQHFSDRKQEHFIAVSINGANEVICTRVVSIGLINKSHVHPREVYAEMISERASALIIAHNHPIGELKPSEEDRQVTKRLKDAGIILGMNLLDHIIFNSKGYYSFAENDEI